jgi:hypothetical protein
MDSDIVYVNPVERICSFTVITSSRALNRTTLLGTGVLPKL